MKTIFIACMLAPFILLAQPPVADKGIRFDHSPFAELLDKAKKENKLVMVDAFTTWCGPCKWMVKNIFPNDTVGIFYNANFINAKIDMEKGEGIEIRKKYNVNCYPTYLFIDGSGQLVHRQGGSMAAGKFVELGKNALNPLKQFTASQNKFNSGKMSPQEMGEYILMRERSCLTSNEELPKYFSTQKDTDLTNELNWTIFKECVMMIKPDSREFKYLIGNKSVYEQLYTVDEVERVLKNVYSFRLTTLLRNKDISGYGNLKGELAKHNFIFGEELILNCDVQQFKESKDWANYANAADKLIAKYKKEDVNFLNNAAWDFYEHIEDKTLLAKAELWSKHAVELKPDYYNYDTYAAVLYKLGKKTEAKTIAEKAIELGKKDGEDIELTEELLEKIKALK